MNRRPLFAIGLVLAGAVTALALPERNLHHYKKDISDGALKDEMKLIKRSLGTKCEHCHVVKPTRDMAADTDTKKTARSMLDMTDVINKKYFTTDFLGFKKPLTATCYMCHKGHEKVETEAKNADDEKRFNAMKESGRKKRTIDAMKKLTDALNKDVFTWKDAPKATCWMCHRGRGEFQVRAPKDTGGDDDDESSDEKKSDGGEKKSDGKKDDGKKDDDD